MNSHEMAKNRRCFIRHPVTMTIHCRKEGHVEASVHEMRDISFGGMYFISSDLYTPGDMIVMEFPVLTIRSRISGEIIWSSLLSMNPVLQFANGMKFLNKQVLFLARMIEQMCCIQKYREVQARQYARSLSGDEAAREWIRMCAARFPGGK